MVNDGDSVYRTPPLADQTQASPLRRRFPLATEKCPAASRPPTPTTSPFRGHPPVGPSLIVIVVLTPPLTPLDPRELPSHAPPPYLHRCAHPLHPPRPRGDHLDGALPGDIRARRGIVLGHRRTSRRWSVAPHALPDGEATIVHLFSPAPPPSPRQWWEW